VVAGQYYSLEILEKIKNRKPIVAGSTLLAAKHHAKLIIV